MKFKLGSLYQITPLFATEPHLSSSLAKFPVATHVATLCWCNDTKKVSSHLQPGLRSCVTLGSAEGGTRTPMPFRAQRPERCVSTNFTTSAEVSLWTGVSYCNSCELSRGVLGFWVGLCLSFLFHGFSVGKRVIISVDIL